MTLETTLLLVALVLVAIAIGVQVFYLRGLARAGVEITTALKAVSAVNIAMLVMLALGLLYFAVRSVSGVGV